MTDGKITRGKKPINPGRTAAPLQNALHKTDAPRELTGDTPTAPARLVDNPAIAKADVR